jgi:AAA family ATP:ADP antiporter
MADLLSPDQSHRLFGQIAAGASLGGLVGPLLSGVLVGPLGEAGLLYLSTALLLATLPCARWLMRWRDRNGPIGPVPATQRIGGSIWGGLLLIARSPYLVAIAAFIIFIATANTFLYFEQARIVSATFADRAAQTRVFAAIDTAVQSLTILIQIFATGRLARRLGVSALLAAVPLIMMAGFGLLALAATFPVLAFVMIVRRVGEYALVRPGREMLFAPVDPETKYKAKNALDTFVYRGGDAISGWAYTGIVAVASTGAVAVAGALICGLWALLGLDRPAGATTAARTTGRGTGPHRRRDAATPQGA